MLVEPEQGAAAIRFLLILGAAFLFFVAAVLIHSW
jgi:hypothetical protein